METTRPGENLATVQGEVARRGPGMDRKEEKTIDVIAVGQTKTTPGDADVSRSFVTQCLSRLHVIRVNNRSAPF